MQRKWRFSRVILDQKMIINHSNQSSIFQKLKKNCTSHQLWCIYSKIYKNWFKYCHDCLLKEVYEYLASLVKYNKIKWSKLEFRPILCNVTGLIWIPNVFKLHKKGFYTASGEFSDVGSGQHYITISFAKIAAILDFLSFLYVLEKNW